MLRCLAEVQFKTSLEELKLFEVLPNKACTAPIVTREATSFVRRARGLDMLLCTRHVIFLSVIVLHDTLGFRVGGAAAARKVLSINQKMDPSITPTKGQLMIARSATVFTISIVLVQ